jgi:hypothetical protein
MRFVRTTSVLENLPTFKGSKINGEYAHFTDETAIFVVKGGKIVVS